MSRIAEAERLARECHAGQTRRGSGSAPRHEHCREVAALVAEHGGTEEAVVAAWLHDVVEDSPKSLGAIERQFGKRVAAIVAALTDDPDLGTEEARAAQVREAPALPPEAALVKVADQTSNLAWIAATMPDWQGPDRDAYVAKAQAVVAGLKGIPEALRARFRAAAEAAEAHPS